MNSQVAPAECEPHARDVLVIGGGPAGTTVATLLAQKGWSVILLEKERHPRFHIGESLLPMNLPIFERLGVLQQVHDIGVIKYGAEFNTASSAEPSLTYEFGNAMDKSHPHAYQVKRSEFDHLLLENSRKNGVEVRENTRVTDVDFTAQHHCTVSARDNGGNKHTLQCRFVVDASGRSTFLSSKLRHKKKNPKHNSAAIFGHFNNVQRRSGAAAGNISIYWFEHGWFWMIPLRDDVMSVGAVCWPEYLASRKTTPEAFLWDTIKACPPVYERMRHASLVEGPRATGNYSYLSERMYGKNHIIVGDAFAFIDPVFSSGVFLAMNSACLASDTVDAYLKDPARGMRELRRYDKTVRRGLKRFSWFIYRFTSPQMRHLFMNPSNRFRIQEAVTSLLAGDLFRQTPIRYPLLLFKAIYYFKALANARPAVANFINKKRNRGLVFADETTHSD